MYRTLLAHQYDQYMAAAIAAGLPPHPSPSPPSHRPLPPPAHSPSGAHSSPVPPPRFSPQQQQTAALLAAAVAAATNNRGQQPSINGGDRIPVMHQVSPGAPQGMAGHPHRASPTPSPPIHSGENSDTDERSRHRRKQGQPRRQTVIYPPEASPSQPSDDSGGSYCSPPPQAAQPPLPSPPVSHSHDLPVSSVRHQSEMPISQAMSHALAHPFLAAHLNPPSTPPSHSSPRNSPVPSRLTSSQSPHASPHKSSQNKNEFPDASKMNSSKLLDSSHLPSTRDSSFIGSSHNSPLVPSAHNSPHMPSSPHLQSTHNSPHMPHSPHTLSSHDSPHIPSVHNSPHMPNSHNSSLPISHMHNDSSHVGKNHPFTSSQGSLHTEAISPSQGSPFHERTRISAPHEEINNQACSFASRQSSDAVDGKSVDHSATSPSFTSNLHLDSQHMSESLLPDALSINTQSPHTDQSHPSPPLSSSNSSCYNTLRGSTTSPLPPRPNSENSRHSDQSVESDPSRNSDLSRMELSRLHSPLPLSPGSSDTPRSSYNGPLPRAAATPRKVPVDVGSGPARHYEAIDEEPDDISRNDDLSQVLLPQQPQQPSNRNYGAAYYGSSMGSYTDNNNKISNSCYNSGNGTSTTMTPAQKKSLSPLKTINMAALDNFYQDNDHHSDGTKKRHGKKKSTFSTLNNVISDNGKSSNQDLSNADSNSLSHKISSARDEESNLVSKKSVKESEDQNNLEKDGCCKDKESERVANSDATESSPKKKSNLSSGDEIRTNNVMKCSSGKDFKKGTTSSNAHVNNSRNSKGEPITNGVMESSELVQDKLSSSNIGEICEKVPLDGTPLINGGHEMVSPKKGRKRKQECQSLAPLDGLGSDSSEGDGNKRRTRQRRAVSYVEDATDPVQEMTEDGVLSSPAPLGIPSPTKKRGRKSKASEGESLIDALSPSSTATSDSFRDNLSPDRESDKELLTPPLASPTGGRGRGSRGRGRGRPPANGNNTQVSGAHMTDLSPSYVPSGVYDFPDNNDDGSASGTRGKRGGKRGRKRGSPNKRGRRGSRGGLASPPPSVNSVEASEQQEAIENVSPNSNQKDSDALSNENLKADHQSKPEKPKTAFPFLTVKDPSVLLEKYNSKDEESSYDNAELGRPFQGITDLSQCLINSHYDSKDGDSSGDGFSPSSKIDDIGKIPDDLTTIGTVSEPSAHKDDEAPSIAYIPVMGRNRDQALLSRGCSNEKSAIEQVLLTLNENIASLEPPRKNTPPISDSLTDPLALPESTSSNASPSPSVTSHPSLVSTNTVSITRSVRPTSVLSPSVPENNSTCQVSITPVSEVSLQTPAISTSNVRPVNTASPVASNKPVEIISKGRKKEFPQNIQSVIDLENNRLPHTKSNTEFNSDGTAKSISTNSNLKAVNDLLSVQKGINEVSKNSLDNIAASHDSVDQNVYVMSIAETVMSGSPRSSARRASSRSTSSSENGLGSSRVPSAERSRSGGVDSSSDQSPSCNTGSSPRGRRSTRRSNHRNEPEVVQVEVHPEPQSLVALSSEHPSAPNDKITEESAIGRGTANAQNSSSVSNCAKSRDRIQSNNQENMDDITVVPDAEPTVELRSRSSSDHRNMYRISNSVSLKPSRGSRHGPSISNRGIDTDSRKSSNLSKSQKNNSVRTAPSSDLPDQSDLCSTMKLDSVPSEGLQAFESPSNLILADSANCSTPSNDTDSETIENISKFLNETSGGGAADSSSAADVEKKVLTSPNESKFRSDSVSNGKSMSKSKNSSDADKTDNKPNTSGNGAPDEPSKRPRRTPRPPQNEEQIKEVLMLLNMDDEESEDEDYVPKGDDGLDSDAPSVDDSSMDDDFSDDEGEHSDDSDEGKTRASGSSLSELMGKAAAGEVAANKKPHSKGRKKAVSKSSGSKNGIGKGKRCLARKGAKSRNIEEPDLKRKKGNDSKAIDDHMASECGPFIQLVPGTDDEYINNDPLAVPSNSQPKSSTIHFYSENDCKQRTNRVGFNSTLHSNYDAFSKDLTWFCSLCKQFSHYCKLGDLFGPIFIDGFKLVKKHYRTMVDGQVVVQAAADATVPSSTGGSRGRGKRKNEASSTNLSSTVSAAITPDKRVSVS